VLTTQGLKARLISRKINYTSGVMRLTLFTICLLLVWSAGMSEAGTNDSSDGNTAFAFDLYGQLKSSPGNIFFSPYSISTALAMTYDGARGETEKQMRKALHFDSDHVHSSFAELQHQLTELGKKKGLQLNVANGLWTQTGHPFLGKFVENATKKYQSVVKQVNFKTAAEPVRNDINTWVAKQTRDKIQNLLPPGSIGVDTRLVLVNAIYFKGIWAKPFEKSETTAQPFHRTSSDSIEVRLMHSWHDVRYMETRDLQAVELPYQNGELAMVILLPHQIGGLKTLESQFNLALWNRCLSQLKEQHIEVFLPRFKLEQSAELSPALSKLGMKDAFSQAADFSGIDGTHELFISGVFHKAWGEINEEGTEAAAATAVPQPASAVPVKRPPTFRADHPFLFFLRDTRSGTILFIGRFSEPAV
jgi:serpin B